MERRRRSFRRDERALSDAVAIVIFVAAALLIGGTVVALVSSKAPTGAAPTASIAIQTVGGDPVIMHNGGDSIPMADLNIYVYSYPDLTIVNGYPKSMSNASLTTDTSPADVFNSGDVVKISGFSSGSYKIVVEYIPTKTQIASGLVTI